jgi:hypothetical protein
MLLPGICHAGERIPILVVGTNLGMEFLRPFFDSEPAVAYHFVPASNLHGYYLNNAEILKMIRLYFPRSYEKLRSFEVLILNGPEFNLITKQQDQWMYDAIKDGMGGINDVSVFSIISGVAEAWSASQTQLAFPNDAPAVTARGAGEVSGGTYSVVINVEARYPILTPFIPFGVEDIQAPGGWRFVIHRQGSDVLAWRVGAGTRYDYIAAWEYEKGRTITNGNGMAIGWQGYPRNPQDNQYAGEILMNMMYWLAQRELIEDIEVFHRVKGNFAEFRSRMAVLISLLNFIDKFGANTANVQGQITGLDELYATASDLYLDQEFVACESDILDALGRFSSVEEMARREKDRALMWVYIIEWFASVSTLFVSGFVLWTLMVRRRLYREIDATRLRPT